MIVICRPQTDTIRIHRHIFSMFLARALVSNSDIIDQIGSALCGAAQTMTWLIVCRAIQGIGGGGIIQLVQITISDIVSLQE
jgi:MFS family permease